MKRMLAIAAFLLASSNAQAQYEFQYGGRTIRIDPDRGTVSIPRVHDNTGKKSKRAKEQDGSRKSQDAKVEPQPAPAAEPAPATTAPAAAPAPVAAAPAATAAPASPPPPPPASATTAPDPSTAPPPPAPSTETAALPPPAPPVQQAAPPLPPASTVATAPPAPPPAARPAPAAVPGEITDPNSPIGVWLTEEKKGKVRIELCGPNLCGYSVDAQTNLNGERVLINMKPAQGLKWTGRIHDPNTGSNYDSTIALKGDTLRVQGCAFGEMFCGAQTWTRVN
jgi:hypothetical protein